MPYEFNPHCHVRIWFSNKRYLEINYQNKRRLITLRTENPNASLFLIYAKQLLNDDAIRRLTTFCRRYRITLLSMETDVIPFCTEEEEKKLISIYQSEIDSLHEGGNLAAASDCVRLLGPVYRRGTYSDFDTVIRTRDLPKTVPVEAPLLFNIGSCRYADMEQLNELESLIFCNDLFAVLSEDEDTLKKIKSLQNSIYEAYHNPQIYLHHEKQIEDDILNFLSKQPEFAHLKEFQIRLNINAQILSIENAHPIGIRKRLNTYLKEDSEFSAEQHQKLSSLTVLHTSGPYTQVFSLFEHFLMSSNEIHKEVKPYSFTSYPSLTKRIHSKESFSFHLHEVKKDGVSDLSWLPLGEKRVSEAEQKKAAKVIQRYFRYFKSKEILQCPAFEKDDSSPQMN